MACMTSPDEHRGEIVNGDSLGEVAYQAYGDARGWQTFSGDHMPSWTEQSPGLRAAWDSAAQAVAEELRSPST
jgi:hypothetical protein